MGMKVAAVALMCQDARVFAAMEMAGTPCPYMGKIGKEAEVAWDANPQERPDYKEYKERLEGQIKRQAEEDAVISEMAKNERNAFVKACKNTKHLDGKHKGLFKSGRTCKREWAESQQG